MVQVALGAATLQTAKQPLVTSLHVVVGAALLASSGLFALEAMFPRVRRTRDAAHTTS